MLYFFSSHLKAQVVINEVQTSNMNTIVDEFGKNDDWIELYNTSSAAIDLTGYKLSDNLQQSDKFVFPSFTLNGNDHILVFASDLNKAEYGGHWETAVYASDSWKYQVNQVAPADTNWRNLSFNANPWNSGVGGIGYGDGDDVTTIPQCISLYMRKIFSIADTSKISAAILNIDYDDAFVAYLNGVEIARSNVGIAGTRPAWNAVASNVHEAVMYQGMNPDSFDLNMGTVRAAMNNGLNVLAIEVHNLAANNQDLSSIPFLTFKLKDATTMFGAPPVWFTQGQIPEFFHADFKLSKTGESVYLFNASSGLVDSIAVPLLEADDSYERNPDGASQWCYTSTPTPEAVNTAGPCISGYATIPLFSIQSGFYPATQVLTITTTFPGGVIHYTTNGDSPDGTSPIYSSPLNISSTTTVRARVYAMNALPSPAITNTYLINFDCKLPVYVLTTDSANLWDYNTGIFVEGPNADPWQPHFGANYWMDWEKPVSVEYFDKAKNLAFRFNGGLSITGGWSRMSNQKPLEISLGDKYGLGELNYSLLSEKPWVDKFDNFVLHTTGNDRGVAHMRDPLMERLLESTHVDHISFEPCLLFINGVQWGVYYTRENDDHHFIEQNYGIKKDDIDLLKESYFVPDQMEVKKGSDSAFFVMYNYAMNTAPNDPAYLPTMNTMMDIENMVDYFAAETFYPNGDWMGGGNNNMKMWRQRSTNGRFRYITYDFDFGYGLVDAINSNVLAEALNASPHNFQSDLFAKLIQNSQFKNYFINRYADLINTIWIPSNVTSLANAFMDSIRYDMHYEFENGWVGGDTNYWKSNVNAMLNFASQRPSYARDFIEDDLGMTSQVVLTLNVSPAGAGRIQISTITPSSLPWNGVYFNGNPVTITAIPNPGYTFDYWHSNVVISINDSNQSTTKNFYSSDQIIAYFTGSPATVQLTISELNYNSDSARDAGDWVEIHNLTSDDVDIAGWKLRDDQDHHIFTFPVSTVLPGNGYLVVAEDLQKFTSRHPSVTNVIGELGFNFGNGGDQLRLYDYMDSLYLSMEYSDNTFWPQGADGSGFTLELVSSSGDLSDGSNWFDGCLEGSPGQAYLPGTATASAAGQTSFCLGGSVILNADTGNGYSYQWQNGSNLIPGGTNSSYDATISGNYSVVVTSNGCAAVSDSIPVTVIPQPADPVIDDMFNCGPGTFTLTVTSPDSITWYDAPNGNILANGNTFTTPYLSGTTIYYLQASHFCQSNFVAVTVTVYQMPVVDFGNDTVVNTSITLDAGSGFDSYLWNNSDTTQTILVENTGTYYVSVTDSNGCTASDTINVLVTVGINEIAGDEQIFIYPNPAHDVVTVRFHSGKERLLQLIDGRGKITWEQRQINTNETHISLEGLVKGIYLLRITSPGFSNGYRIIVD